MSNAQLSNWICCGGRAISRYSTHITCVPRHTQTGHLITTLYWNIETSFCGFIYVIFGPVLSVRLARPRPGPRITFAQLFLSGGQKGHFRDSGTIGSRWKNISRLYQLVSSINHLVRVSFVAPRWNGESLNMYGLLTFCVIKHKTTTIWFLEN